MHALIRTSRHVRRFCATPAKVAPSQGRSKTPLALITAALVAPPVFIAYKINYDEEDQEFNTLLKDNAPFLLEWLDFKTTQAKSPSQPPSKLAKPSESLSYLTAELDSIEAKLQKAQENVKRSTTTKQQSTPQQPSSKVEKVGSATKEGDGATPAAVASDSRSGEKDKLKEKIRNAPKTLEEISQKAQKNTENKLRNMEEELSKDLSVVLAKDLGNSDVEMLRKRIVELVMELKDRHRWEALRIQELTKLQTQDMLAEYNTTLSEQAEAYESLIAREKESVKKKEREKMKRKHKEIVMAKEKEWVEKTQRELEEQSRKMGVQLDKFIQQEREKVEEQASHERKQRLHQMEEMAQQVQQLKSKLEQKDSHNNLSQRVHKMSICMFDLIEKVHGSKAVGSELRSLREEAGGDPIVIKVLDSLPDRLYTVGVPTKNELGKRFENDVFDSCQKTALLPPEGGGMMQVALANVVQALSLSENSAPTGSDAEATLLRVKTLVAKGALDSALKEIEQLPPNVKQTASDWIVLAKERVAADQALAFLRAHIASLAMDAQQQ